MWHSARFDSESTCIEGLVIDGEACPKFTDPFLKLVAVFIDVVIVYDLGVGSPIR